MKYLFTLCVLLAPALVYADAGTEPIAEDAGSPASVAAPATTQSDVAATPVIALPPLAGEPRTVGEAADTGLQLYKAIKAGDWSAVYSLALMLVVFGLRMFWHKIPHEALPWLSAAIGMAFQVSLSLSQGQALLQAINSGLMAGAAASGFWGLVGKRLLGPKVAAQAG